MAGTPWHLETLRMSEDDERRHKSRCINYKKPTKTCKVLKRTCPGSAHCEYYKEDPTRIKTVDDTEISSGNYRKPETGSEQNNSVSVAKTDTTVIYDGTILYPLGSHVRHKIHGSGIVSKVEKDYVTVVFDEGISKEFSVDYCTKNSMLVREINDEEIRIAQEKEEARLKAKRAAEEQALKETLNETPPSDTIESTIDEIEKTVQEIKETSISHNVDESPSATETKEKKGLLQSLKDKIMTLLGRL